MKELDRRLAFQNEVQRVKGKYGLSCQVRTMDLANLLNQGRDNIRLLKAPLSRADRFRFPLYALMAGSWSKASAVFARHEPAPETETFFYELALLYASMIMERRDGLEADVWPEYQLLGLRSIEPVMIEGREMILSLSPGDRIRDLGLGLPVPGSKVTAERIEAMIEEDLADYIDVEEEDRDQPDEEVNENLDMARGGATVVLMSTLAGVLMYGLFGVNIIPAGSEKNFTDKIFVDLIIFGCLLFGLVILRLGISRALRAPTEQTPSDHP